MDEGTEKLIRDLEKLIGNREVRNKIRNRMKEFEKVRNEDCYRIFSELSFCILTANYSAEGGIRIQRTLGDEGFSKMPIEKLSRKLKELGHRYPSTRAKYIVEARKKMTLLCEKVRKTKEKDVVYLREWLVTNIKGIGYKEASHFLRNIGYKNIAIIDYHILDLLSRYGIIEKPRYMNKTKYHYIERILRKISDKIGIPLGELDLYLWYLETGKILK